MKEERGELSEGKQDEFRILMHVDTFLGEDAPGSTVCIIAPLSEGGLQDLK